MYSQSIVTRHQQGAVLSTGLIILMGITLLGTTAMHGTTLEEKMTGNFRDANLAFQAGEASLRSGENWLVVQTGAPLASGDGSSGVWGLDTPDANTANSRPWWSDNSMTWWSNNSVVMSSMIGVAAQPRYIIEEQAYVKDHLGTPDYGEMGSGRHFHRITGRATGGSVDSMVLLQSVFAWRFQ